MSNREIDPQALLENEDFPLSNKYDARWVLDNEMGPNALWLTEWLCREMQLKPGMRVLDMRQVPVQRVPCSRVRRPGLGKRPLGRC